MFDKTKLADLKKVSAEKEAEFYEVGTKIRDLCAKDGAMDETDLSKHMALEGQHKVLEREMKAVKAEVDRYEGLKPLSKADQKSPSALRRFLERGADGLEAWEQEKFIGEQNGKSVLKIVGLSTDDSQGENALRTDVANGLVNRLLAYGGTQRMASTIVTGDGTKFVYPSLDDTNNSGTFGAQEAAVPTTDISNIGNVTFESHTCNSGIIPVAREALRDVAFDLDREVADRVVARIGRAESTAYTTGTASTAPLGVVGQAKAGLTSAASDAITVSELINLQYEVDRAYRDGSEGGGANAVIGTGRVGYLISDAAEKAIRTLLDSQGRPLWEPSLVTGEPNTLLGYPYEVSSEMDDLGTTGNVPVLFGNFAYFKIRRVQGVEVFSFMDSATMVNNRIHVVAFSASDSRAAGAIVNSKCEAIAKLTMA